MKTDFTDERGYKKFRVVSGTTIMQQEIRKQARKEEAEARRIERLKERQAKKNEGQLSLF